MKRWIAGLAAVVLATSCSTQEATEQNEDQPRVTPLESWGESFDMECAPYWQAAMEECTPSAPCPQGQVSVCDYKLTMPMGCGGWGSDCGMDGQIAPIVCCSAQVCANCRCDSPGEVCGNLIDDDMDGGTDEGCPPVLKYEPDFPGSGGASNAKPWKPPLKVPKGVTKPIPHIPGGKS